LCEENFKEEVEKGGRGGVGAGVREEINTRGAFDVKKEGE